MTFITKTFELLKKSCAKINLLCMNIFNVQLHVHLKSEL